MTDAPKKNLAQRLLDIIAEIGVVEKKGTNREHNYAFLQATDLLKAIRPLAIQHGVLFLPAATRAPDTLTKSGTPIANLDGTLRIINADDPSDTLEISFTGSGMDTQDKGTSKALTTGLKSAYKAVLMVADVGDDIEHDEGSSEQPVRETPQAVAVVAAGDRKLTPKQKDLLMASLREKGLEPGDQRTKDFVRFLTTKTSSKDLTSDDLDKILAFLRDVESVTEENFPVPV